MTYGDTTPFRSSARLAALALVCTAATTGCGDLTGSEGDLGKVRYELFTSYLSEDADLSTAVLVTGHEQTLHTELTASGAEEVDDPEAVTHRLTDSSGASLINRDDPLDPADILITGTQTGEVTIESLNGSALLDTITLSFGTPDELEMVTWVKPAEEDEFRDEGNGDNLSVGEGDQITFLPIPKSAGKRLLGDIEFSITTDPPGAAVEVENIVGVYEQRVVSATKPVSLVFIEPGSVTVTIADTAGQVTVTRSFEVTGSPDGA